MNWIGNWAIFSSDHASGRKCGYRGKIAGACFCIKSIQRDYNIPIIVSTHPRTRERLGSFKVVNDNPQVRFLDPFGFFDFIQLERNAFCVLSDSGTVQEECAIFKVANVTLRDVTERPETIECGSNILSGVSSESIRRCVNIVLGQKSQLEHSS